MITSLRGPQIRRVLDRDKSRIGALQPRALRADPLLQGKVAFQPAAAPSGAVTACSTAASEIGVVRGEA